MTQRGWCNKLHDWIGEDERLSRLPYMFIIVLAEHLAKHDGENKELIYSLVGFAFSIGFSLGLLFCLVFSK